MDAKYDWENLSNLHFAFAWWFIHTSRCQYKWYRLDKYVFEKFVCTKTEKCQRNAINRMQLIECDYRAHLVSKAGSVIGAKSPSPAFKWI